MREALFVFGEDTAHTTWYAGEVPETPPLALGMLAQRLVAAGVRLVRRPATIADDRHANEDCALCGRLALMVALRLAEHEGRDGAASWCRERLWNLAAPIPEATEPESEIERRP